MTMTVTARLALRQAVEPYAEALVDLADATLTTNMMNNLLQHKMRAAQINNLLGVSLETSSPAVVVNWVRYQMGRKETREAWGNTGLGKQIIADINRIKQPDMAGKVAEMAFRDSSEEHIREAQIVMVRLYIGYLKRWFVAKGGQE
jgi:hypothetical protein